MFIYIYIYIFIYTNTVSTITNTMIMNTCAACVKKKNKGYPMHNSDAISILNCSFDRLFFYTGA